MIITTCRILWIPRRGKCRRGRTRLGASCLRRGWCGVVAATVVSQAAASNDRTSTIGTSGTGRRDRISPMVRPGGAGGSDRGLRGGQIPGGGPGAPVVASRLGQGRDGVVVRVAAAERLGVG